MLKKLAGFLIVGAIFSAAFFSYIREEAYAIPLYPSYCIRLIVNENISGGNIQVFRNDPIRFETLHIRRPDYFDQVIYKVDGITQSIVRGTNIGTLTFNESGIHTIRAEIEGYDFIYHGNIYDAEGNNLGGAGLMGSGGERYTFEDIKTSCEIQVEVLEKPTPVSSPITVKNATTGGTFSGTGTPTDPYLVPNRTNTRFSIALMSGESITSWMVNGSKVNRTLPQFDYTLWRIGEWTFGTEIKQADGSTREESVYLKSF